MSSRQWTPSSFKLRCLLWLGDSFFLIQTVVVYVADGVLKWSLLHGGLAAYGVFLGALFLVWVSCLRFTHSTPTGLLFKQKLDDHDKGLTWRSVLIRSSLMCVFLVILFISGMVASYHYTPDMLFFDRGQLNGYILFYAPILVYLKITLFVVEWLDLWVIVFNASNQSLVDFLSKTSWIDRRF